MIQAEPASAAGGQVGSCFSQGPNKMACDGADFGVAGVGPAGQEMSPGAGHDQVGADQRIDVGGGFFVAAVLWMVMPVVQRCFHAFVNPRA